MNLESPFEAELKHTLSALAKAHFAEVNVLYSELKFIRNENAVLRMNLKGATTTTDSGVVPKSLDSKIQDVLGKRVFATAPTFSEFRCDAFEQLTVSKTQNSFSDFRVGEPAGCLRIEAKQETSVISVNSSPDPDSLHSVETDDAQTDLLRFRRVNATREEGTAISTSSQCHTTLREGATNEIAAAVKAGTGLAPTIDLLQLSNSAPVESPAICGPKPAAPTCDLSRPQPLMKAPLPQVFAEDTPMAKDPPEKHDFSATNGPEVGAVQAGRGLVSALAEPQSRRGRSSSPGKHHLESSNTPVDSPVSCTQPWQADRHSACTLAEPESQLPGQHHSDSTNLPIDSPSRTCVGRGSFTTADGPVAVLLQRPCAAPAKPPPVQKPKPPAPTYGGSHGHPPEKSSPACPSAHISSWTGCDTPLVKGPPAHQYTSASSLYVAESQPRRGSGSADECHSENSNASVDMSRRPVIDPGRFTTTDGPDAKLSDGKRPLASKPKPPAPVYAGSIPTKAKAPPPTFKNPPPSLPESLRPTRPPLPTPAMPGLSNLPG